MQKFTFLFTDVTVPGSLLTECSNPLGLGNKGLPDSSFTASSSYNAGHGPSNGRLNFQAGGGKTGAWSARTNDVNQWLQIDLGQAVHINYIQTQGREDCCNQFVTSYTVSYSLDNIKYEKYQKYGKEVVSESTLLCLLQSFRRGYKEN